MYRAWFQIMQCTIQISKYGNPKTLTAHSILFIYGLHACSSGVKYLTSSEKAALVIYGIPYWISAI
jgi:hypothetical protein